MSRFFPYASDKDKPRTAPVLLLAAVLVLLFSLPARCERMFSSKRPGGSHAAVSEIDAKLGVVTSYAASADEFKRSRGWPEPQDSGEAAVAAGIVSSLESVLGDLNRLKADFDYLRRDFVSIRAKNELIRSRNAIGQSAGQTLSGIREINVRDLSYEISLLEDTINSKNEEKEVNQKEAARTAELQDRLLDRFVSIPPAGDSEEITIVRGRPRPPFREFEKAARRNLAVLEYVYSANLARYFELKLLTLGQNVKNVNFELATARQELDEKKRVEAFVKSNPLATFFGARPKSSTSEVEAQKPKTLSRPALESDALKHKANLASEVEELSKFALKIANFSAEIAHEETKSIKKLYDMMSGGGPAKGDEDVAREMASCRSLRDETEKLASFIKSDRKKVESQITLLRSELASRESELSALGARREKTSREAEQVREILQQIIENLKKRISTLEQYSQHSKKYGELVAEKTRNIDNTIRALSAYINEREERIQLKTFSEAYSAFVAIASSGFFFVESIPGAVADFRLDRSHISGAWLFLRKAFACLLVFSLIYLAARRFAQASTPRNIAAAVLADVYHYLIALVGFRAFIVVYFGASPVWGPFWTFILVSLLGYRIVQTAFHRLFVSEFISSDAYFRVSLFLRFLLFAVPLLIVTAFFSGSLHLAVLAKFLFKVAALVLSVALLKPYKKRALSCFFVSKRRLRAYGYGEWAFHLADLYNDLLSRHNLLILTIALTAASIYFAGYLEFAFYMVNSSFLTFILYSVLYLAPRFAGMTFDWIFIDDTSLTATNAYVRFKEKAVVYIRVFYRIFFVVIFVLFTLKIWGFQIQYLLEAFTSELAMLLARKVVVVASVVFGSFIASHYVEKFADDFVRNALSQNASDSIKKRGTTLAPLLKSIAQYGIWFVAAYFILKEVGFDATPIIAGAGILGLAVGFGSQNLVKDIVAGFFIIFEDQYNVGDYILAEGIEGTVEEVSVRTTRIRDLSGTLHIIPNGAITKVANYSKDFSVSRFEVCVAYESDFEKVVAELDSIASRLCDEWELFIIDRSKVVGLIAFGSSSVTIRVQTTLVIGKKFDFECELRMRILKAFQEKGIEIPYQKIVSVQAQPDPYPPSKKI